MGNNLENINLQLRDFPSHFFPTTDASSINEILAAFIKSHNKVKAIKAYKAWLSPFLGEDINRSGNNLPFYFPINSYFNSATIFNLKKNNIEINVKSRIKIDELKK